MLAARYALTVQIFVTDRSVYDHVADTTMASGATAAIVLDAYWALPCQIRSGDVVPPWVLLNHDRPTVICNNFTERVTLGNATWLFVVICGATCMSFCVVDGSVLACKLDKPLPQEKERALFQRDQRWHHHATSRILRQTRYCQLKTSPTIALRDTRPLAEVVLLMTLSMGRTSTVSQGCTEVSQRILTTHPQTRRGWSRQ